MNFQILIYLDFCQKLFVFMAIQKNSKESSKVMIFKKQFYFKLTFKKYIYESKCECRKKLSLTVNIMKN